MQTLVVTNRTASGFFDAAVSQLGVKDTPRNRKLCADVIAWCQDNEDYLLTVKTVCTDRESFVLRAVDAYKADKYGSVLMIIAFQLAWTLIKIFIDAYFFSKS